METLPQINCVHAPDVEGEPENNSTPPYDNKTYYFEWLIDYTDRNPPHYIID